jgi:hypothetical protein
MLSCIARWPIRIAAYQWMDDREQACLPTQMTGSGRRMP